jgi:nucleoid DNA-binding protein
MITQNNIASSVTEEHRYYPKKIILSVLWVIVNEIEKKVVENRKVTVEDFFSLRVSSANDVYATPIGEFKERINSKQALGV